MPPKGTSYFTKEAMNVLRKVVGEMKIDPEDLELVRTKMAEFATRHENHSLATLKKKIAELREEGFLPAMQKVGVEKLGEIQLSDLVIAPKHSPPLNKALRASLVATMRVERPTEVKPVDIDEDFEFDPALLNEDDAPEKSPKIAPSLAYDDFSLDEFHSRSVQTTTPPKLASNVPSPFDLPLPGVPRRSPPTQLPAYSSSPVARNSVLPPPSRDFLPPPSERAKRPSPPTQQGSMDLRNPEAPTFKFNNVEVFLRNDQHSSKGLSGTVWIVIQLATGETVSAMSQKDEMILTFVVPSIDLLAVMSCSESIKVRKSVEGLRAFPTTPTSYNVHIHLPSAAHAIAKTQKIRLADGFVFFVVPLSEPINDSGWTRINTTFEVESDGWQSVGD